MTVGRAAALAALLAVAACRRTAARAEEAPVPEAGLAEAGLAETTVDAGAVRPPRCDRGATAVALPGADAGPGALEVGDALAAFGGYAVALVHRGPAGAPVAAVVLVDPASTRAPRVVDLGPTLGDAPPPRLALKDDVLLAAAYEGPGRGESRDLSVHAVKSDGTATARWRLAQQRDDSLAYDLAAGRGATLAVWDEASRAARGVIRAAVLAAGDAEGHPRDLSPPTSDAELPRVVATAAGFVAFWIARSAEGDARDDAGANEVAGEARSFGWLEALALDEHGNPGGAARGLTPPQGHVSAYDVLALGGGASVLVVARDDGEAVDGSGGALLRVRVFADHVEPALAFPTDGLGRGAPELVDARPPWLAWVGPNERLRLVPLDESGAPAGPPSAEEAMNDARPLVGAVAASTAPNVALLVASPDDPSAQLREFSCAR
jgi:hypothetical protein